MFLGHFGAALTAKSIDKNPSLGTLIFASQFIDLLWPIFLILGIEKVSIDPGSTVVTPLEFTYYPFSHSLVGVLFWAILFGIIYYIVTKRRTTALLVSILVISHWVLDLVVHKPDLPLSIDNNFKFGFGLWNSFILTLILEFLLLILGAYLYLKSTKPKNKKGKWLLWSLIIFLVVIYLMNLFGPAPPDSSAIGYAGLAQWLFVGWGYWIDKNRFTV